MAANERNVKGRALIGYCKYIKKKWGADGLQEFEKSTGINSRDYMEDKWYPATDTEKLIEWIATTHGPIEVRNAARSMVTEVGIISFMARAAGMDRVLDKALDETRETLSYGHISVKKEAWGATVSLNDYCAGPHTYEAWIGIMEGTMQLTKTKGKVEKLSCELKGDKACVYKMTWDK
jgi:hypothetical protein